MQRAWPERQHGREASDRRLRRGDRTRAETSISAVTEASALLAYRVNALGPVLVSKAFAPLLASTAAERGRGQPTLVVNLSARLSSIRENKLGGWYSYRASKAALNMLTKSLAVEFAKEGKAVACLLLHPGTVATDLSRPFNRNGERIRRGVCAAAPA